MPTVVIVHAADDALPARALAEKLRQAKLTVTLEHPPGGETQEAAKGANAVVALWSPRSVAQQSLIDDVAAVRGKGVIHARMQNAALPAQFGNERSIDLTGWRGEEEFPAWRDLAKAVTSKAGVPNLPPPAPKPPSGFFQPGAPNPAAMAAAEKSAARGGGSRPPPPRQSAPPPRAAPPPPPRPAPRPAPAPSASASSGERKSGGGGMIIAIIVFLIVAGAAGGGYFWWSGQQSAQSANAAWEQLDKNDAAALRTFAASHTGAMHDQAETALSHLEEASFTGARDADTVEAFQNFLRDFPDSRHALEARGRIQELQQATTTTGTETTTATTSTNPDLLPPNAASTNTATTPPSGGPVPLTPQTNTATTTQPPG